MRPHKPSKNKATGVARARLIIKSKLWWLSGVHYRGQWLVVPLRGEKKSELVNLDRSDLRRATYAVTKLANEFPRALPSIVGDSKAWVYHVRQQIDLLKPWIHKGECPVDNLFELQQLYSVTERKLAKQVASMSPDTECLVASLSWIMASRPGEVRKYLVWIRAHAEPLSVIFEKFSRRTALVLALQVTHLGAVLGSNAVSPLMHLLGNRAVYDFALNEGDAFVNHALRSIKPNDAVPETAPEEPKLSAALYECVEWMISQDNKTRRRFLDIIKSLELESVVRQWADWWPMVIRDIERILRLSHLEVDTKKIQNSLQESKERINHAKNNMPPGLASHVACEAAREISQTKHAPSIVKAIGELRNPVGPTFRAGMLVHWWQLRKRKNSKSELRLSSIIAGFRACNRHNSKFDLSPWSADAVGLAAGKRCFFTIDDTLFDVDRIKHIPYSFEALRLFHYNHPKTELTEVAENLICLVENFGEPELAQELAWQLVKTDQDVQWMPEATLQAARTASGENLERFGEFIDAFTKLTEGIDLPATRLYSTLQKAFDKQSSLLPVLLTSKHQKKLKSCVLKLSLLAEAGRPLPIDLNVVYPDGGWLKRYPKRLHEVLSQLSRVSADAEKIAKRVTKGSVVDGDAIRKEIEVLSNILDDAAKDSQEKLIRRLDNLRTRLENPEPVSDSRIQRLKVRLTTAIASELLRQVDEEASKSLSVAIARILDRESLPDWVFLDENLVLILHALRLQGERKSLAVRLFKLRCSNAPWDLRTVPENAEFLESLRTQDIDTQPWLDGLGDVCFPTQKGEVVLSLENDPLEVFKMGGYFQTCLSPGDFNYFSVFSNAADVNKRVLYGRTTKGQVVGRRLICLTDQGNLLPFYSYCHDQGFEFEENSKQFAIQLSQAMGVAIVPNGKISRLVAPDWYDDGPTDITEQFSFLADGSAFRESLKKLESTDLFEEVQKVSAGHSIEAVVVPLLLRLPEFSQRPELAVALISRLRIDQIPSECFFTAVRLLERGGASNLAGQFTGRVAEQQREWYRLRNWIDYEALDYLARHSPSLALRVLRETRSRGVRSWSQEMDAERLAAAGTANVNLNRPRQALKLYQKAASVEGHRAITDFAVKRVRELSLN